MLAITNRARNLFIITLLASVLLLIFNIKHEGEVYKIPSTIKNQLNFPVLFLKNPSNGNVLEKNSIKYSLQPDGSMIFSYIVDQPDNSITISEQAYPEILIYDKLANSINPYSEVGTLYGKATLGRPKDHGGHQVAVLKYTDSTLIFAQSRNDISDPDWRQLINSLDTVK
jgi:hypothetical protein